MARFVLFVTFPCSCLSDPNFFPFLLPWTISSLSLAFSLYLYHQLPSVPFLLSLFFFPLPSAIQVSFLFPLYSSLPAFSWIVASVLVYFRCIFPFLRLSLFRKSSSHQLLLTSPKCIALTRISCVLGTSSFFFGCHLDGLSWLWLWSS